MVGGCWNYWKFLLSMGEEFHLIKANAHLDHFTQLPTFQRPSENELYRLLGLHKCHSRDAIAPKTPSFSTHWLSLNSVKVSGKFLWFPTSLVQ